MRRTSRNAPLALCLLATVSSAFAQIGPSGSAPSSVLFGPKPTSAADLLRLPLSYSDQWSDPELGGITFRGQGFNPSERRLGSPYVETLYASQLFKLMGNPTLEAFARRKGTDPKSPEVKSLFVKETSDQLNQIFVLKSIAAMLDTEARLKGVKFEVPYERLDYAVSRILRLGNRELNDLAFESYVRTKVMEAVQKGPEEVKRLSEIGLSETVVNLITGEKPVEGDPRELFEQFKNDFDSLVLSGRADAKVLGALSAEMRRRYDDLRMPARNPNEHFERLKEKIGTSPFFFAISWEEGTQDESLAAIASQFKEKWSPVAIGGQNPQFGMSDAFPEDLDKFYRYLESKLLPRHKSVVRRSMANHIFFNYYRNRDILNPRPNPNATGVSSMFNPMSTMMMMTQAEFDETYEELKAEVAAKPLDAYRIVEVKLGDSQADVAPNAPTHPCVLVFNRAFERPYTELQKTILAGLADPALTTKGFDQLIARARTEVPSRAFEAGRAALAADAACNGFAVTMQVYDVSAQGDLQALSEEAKARAAFAGMVANNPSIQGMMIPKRARRDAKGNVYHYFFMRRQVEYLPMLPFAGKPEANERVRGLVGKEIEALDAQEKAVHKALSDRVSEKKDEASKKALSQFLEQVVKRPCGNSIIKPRSFEYRLECEIYRQSSQVREAVRDAIAMRRLADRMAEAAIEKIAPRYRIHARLEPFAFEGVDGFQLKAAVTEPRTWIPQAFVWSRPQRNLELMLERNIVERSSKVFEKAYDIQ